MWNHLSYWQVIKKQKEKKTCFKPKAEQTSRPRMPAPCSLRVPAPFWGQVGSEYLLNLILDRLIIPERLSWTSWLLYSHVLALFLLILLVPHFTALPHDLLSPKLLLSAAGFDRFSQFYSHYYFTQFPPHPLFAVLYTCTKTYWELQMHSAPSKSFNTVIA